MEVAMSAVAGELVSRFISFLLNKYNSSCPRSEQKVEERLQHLLMRAYTIIEEADNRYIANSGMMMQLKTLSEVMYRGYRMLDTLRYQTVQDRDFVKVSNDSSSTSLYLAIPIKRSRKISDKDDEKGTMHLESLGVMESLEIAVANIAEFVVLLAGCDRMSRRPYDIYLYTDNFMFSRHVEKQKLLSFLLEHNNLHSDHAPAVLPIIGGVAVGKKTLVAHVCGDERVRLRFSSIMHLNGDGLLRILDHGSTMEGMVLVVIEFASDVGDDDWKKFHSFVTKMGKGSKIVIVSRLQRLARFGSVKPVFLNALSYDELTYLFKRLTFGSVDPAENPRLVQIADEFAKELHTHGSLVTTNLFADVLRRNFDVKFWCSILEKGLRMVQRNISMYGLHPMMLTEQGQTVDITDLAIHPLSMTRYTVNASIKDFSSVKLGELLVDPSVIPKEDFILVSWESRIPPHNSFAHFVTSHAQDTHEGNALQGRKRRGVPV